MARKRGYWGAHRRARGCSSDGRALQSHCRGQGFDPPQLHDNPEVLPLGVTGNTPDSGSGESWFEPRRGNLKLCNDIRCGAFAF